MLTTKSVKYTSMYLYLSDIVNKTYIQWWSNMFVVWRNYQLNMYCIKSDLLSAFARRGIIFKNKYN